MRTPNVQPNPDDYEFSLGISNENYYLKRDWERELGSKYIDDVIWYKVENGVYFKPEYLNKQSKDVKYLKLDWRNKSKDWTYGFTTRSTDKNLSEYATFFSAGMSKQKTVGKWDVTFSFDGYLPPKDDGSLDGNLFEFENKFNIKYKLNERTSIYNIGEFYSLQGQKFYKAKIGLEYKL
tara:strand:- start:846 stop:1382 length:537 start_codon:yes stop_codon:yes gene_type:complete